jgi:hypothetical protein
MSAIFSGDPETKSALGSKGASMYGNYPRSVLDIDDSKALAAGIKHPA